MISSMTGYGKGEAQGNGWNVSASLKTLNHKYLDINLIAFEEHELLELQARELIRHSFSRGRVEVRLALKREGDIDLSYNLDTATQYYKFLAELSKSLGIKEPVTLDHLLRLEGVIERAKTEDETLWPLVQQTLKAAIEQARAMRAREGEHLALELRKHLGDMNTELAEIESHAATIKLAYKERLAERIRELLDGTELDPERLETEVAIFAERADITEEVARLKIHLQAAEETFKKPEPAGQILDFLAQEMGREVNTIGAKAKNGNIARSIIAMKATIEKFREQVRNVE
ncbi:YicC family protein [Candidatus Acetothermia bacterium]|nr:YicC family protein [Candidatus Acetothermia bacterium]MBI3659358.1 YicC family protein [Candidatus Acetothermia bacterium]